MLLLMLACPTLVWCQTTIPNDRCRENNQPSEPWERQSACQSKSQNSDPAASLGTTTSNQEPDRKTTPSQGRQTKRILGVMPNFSAVSADTQLPPLSAREKFVIALHDSVDYSSFIWAGILAGQNMALNATPALHRGIAGYGRYYWRSFADQASGAFFTEGLVPAVTREDPRYYTRGHGGFFRRSGYALSRVVVTKTDSGGTSFNTAEVLGNAMEAGLANSYYPPEERGLRKTAQNWGTGLESAALNNILKEFWPDIRRKIFRRD